jgi:hypothetical protein
LRYFFKSSFFLRDLVPHNIFFLGPKNWRPGALGHLAPPWVPALKALVGPEPKSLVSKHGLFYHLTKSLDFSFLRNFTYHQHYVNMKYSELYQKTILTKFKIKYYLFKYKHTLLTCVIILNIYICIYILSKNNIIQDTRYYNIH